jgi:phage shock protein A
MSIFQRITNLLRANINDLLDRAEDPEKMIKQMIMDMEEGVREGKVALAAAITEEKKLKAAYEENLEQANNWFTKAELALEKGEEELAREALKRRKTHEDNATSFKTQWEEQRKTVSSMREDVDALESKLAEAKAKKDILIARKRRAEASKKVNESLAGISKNNAFETFARMEEKIEHMEAQAQAAAEVRQDSLEERFAKLGDDKDVEDDLAALKARLAAKKTEGSANS